MEVRTNGLQAVNPVQAEEETRPEEAVTSTGLVSVVVPTRNERSNMAPLLARLAALRENHRLEIIVVDDSDDGTAEAAEYAAVLLGLGAGEWTVVHRQAPRRVGGLSGAVVEGLALASGEWVVVMDGDLQHPPETIDEMLALAAEQNAGLVVAVRRDAEHGYDSLSPVRRTISRTFRSTARAVLPRLIGELSDPMSGFFTVRRDALDSVGSAPRASRSCSKIVDAIRSCELPSSRSSSAAGAGESKANRSARRSLRPPTAWPWMSRCVVPPVTGYWYDIHGLYSIRSEQALAGAREVPASIDSASRPIADVEVGGLLEGPAGRDDRPQRQQPASCRYRERAGFAVDVDPLRHQHARFGSRVRGQVAARALHERRRADPAVAAGGDGITCSSTPRASPTRTALPDHGPDRHRQDDDDAEGARAGAVTASCPTISPCSSPRGRMLTLPEAAHDQSAHRSRVARDGPEPQGAARAQGAEPAPLP